MKNSIKINIIYDYEKSEDSFCQVGKDPVNSESNSICYNLSEESNWSIKWKRFLLING